MDALEAWEKARAADAEAARKRLAKTLGDINAHAYDGRIAFHYELELHKDFSYDKRWWKRRKSRAELSYPWQYTREHLIQSGYKVTLKSQYYAFKLDFVISWEI